FGGWQRFTSEQMQGTPRSLHPWASLAGEQFYGSGTELKYYQIRGGALIDITPIRRTVTLANDPITIISAAGGVTLIEVADTLHQAIVNDFVTLSGVVGPIGGLDASVFNAEHQITAIPTDNTIRFNVTGTGTAATGGGAAVEAAYQINTGIDSTVLGAGWGTDTFGSGGWGLASDQLTISDRLRLWHQDNFGEDLIFNVQDGGIYYKDMSAGVTSRGFELQDAPSANDAPVIARQVLVSDNDRHVLFFGTNQIGSSAQDPLLVRWSDQENPFDGEITTTTTAGSLRIDSGSEIIIAVESRGEILVFTDVTVHALRFVGPPFIFGQVRIGTNTSLIGPNAVATDGVNVFWMGRGGFYRHTGQIQELRCDVKDYVFRNINEQQSGKITAGINRLHSEVFWYMPFGDVEENNFYVVYNYEQDIWYYGMLNRTVWIDARFEAQPLAGSPDGYIYAHEVGASDNSVIPPVALNSYVESSDIELGTGDTLMYVRRLLPDVTFDGSTATTPQVTIQLETRNYQGEAYRTQKAPTVARIAVGPPEQFNGLRNNVRMRGRYIRYRIEADQIGVRWRQGIPKLQVQSDGLR
ncbi:MAG: hypothetical protein V6Z86_09965, partial [Hyphomicrobiales bacterium]